jgi:predicted AlkP superfamily phosphohydrolase/phosphomutase
LPERPQPKLLVIGLDAVPANLIFNELVEYLPNLRKLSKTGIHGVLTSCHPPITVPAWTVMMSSKDPGTLGIYGFRHRRGASYTDPWIVNSSTVTHNRIWEILEKYDKRSVIIGLPPAYPPYEIHGKLISCFLTPRNANVFTYPQELRNQIEDIVSEYTFDVVFRTEDRDTILKQIYDMTERRFAVIKKWLTINDWDFFIFMEIGTDRMHHAFWKFYDKSHPNYIRDNKYEDVIPNYYKFIDKKIGEVLQLIDNNTITMVVSDHGTKSMRGAFCINEWLLKEGYLVLKSYPTNVIDIEKAEVDWKKTSAWGWGGYYGRIFLNVKGREPDGVIKENEYDRFIEELKEKLYKITDPEGRRMNTYAYKPDEMYRNVVGDRPDLMVYFDDLYWRSAGTIGHKTLYLDENDTGPDDSVHSMDGLFIIYDPRKITSQGLDNGGSRSASIYDIAPTVLKLFNIDVPADMQGKSIL